MRWTAVVIFGLRLVYFKIKSVPASIKSNRWLGDRLGASGKGKYTISQNVSAIINILAISMKTVDRERYIRLAERLKSFVKGFKVWKKNII